MEQSYYIDEKITIWRRTYYSIGGTEEETKRVLLEGVEGLNDILDTNMGDSEILYETEELMTPEDNDGQSTMEVFNHRGETIWSNVKKDN